MTRSPQTPRDPSIRSWILSRSYDAAAYPVARVRELKDRTVSVVLPALEVAATIGPIVDRLARLRDLGLIDELVVIDSASVDGTARIAADRGATVHQRAELFPSFGPPLGKGDGLWRGLGVTSGDIVVMMDTDTCNFDDHFLLGLLGPLLEHPELHLVKGSFHRPLHLGSTTLPDEGGRVTELVARPLLNLYFPALAGFVQPLAGEVAARRSLLETLPFPIGYGVEIGMLIDAFNSVGLEGMAQVNLGTREDRPQALRELSAMAYAVAATIIARADEGRALPSTGEGSLLLSSPEGLETRAVSLEERPPLDAVEADASGM